MPGSASGTSGVSGEGGAVSGEPSAATPPPKALTAAQQKVARRKAREQVRPTAPASPPSPAVAPTPRFGSVNAWGVVGMNEQVRQRRAREQALGSFRQNRAGYMGEEERGLLQQLEGHRAVEGRRDADADAILLQAACHGHTDLCELAVAPGEEAGGVAVPIDVEDQWGNTALILAALHGHEETVASLLALGANANKQNKLAGTALIEAAARGYTKCVHTLLEQGEANVNAQNKVGNTPLSMAVFKGHRDTAECLMKHGASAALKDSKGRSALDYAHPRQNSDPGMLGSLKRLIEKYPLSQTASPSPQSRRGSASASAPSLGAASPRPPATSTADRIAAQEQAALVDQLRAALDAQAAHAASAAREAEARAARQLQSANQVRHPAALSSRCATPLPATASAADIHGASIINSCCWRPRGGARRRSTSSARRTRSCAAS